MLLPATLFNFVKHLDVRIGDSKVHVSKISTCVRVIYYYLLLISQLPLRLVCSAFFAFARHFLITNKCAGSPDFQHVHHVALHHINQFGTICLLNIPRSVGFKLADPDSNFIYDKKKDFFYYNQNYNIDFLKKDFLQTILKLLPCNIMILKFTKQQRKSYDLSNENCC